MSMSVTVGVGHGILARAPRVIWAATSSRSEEAVEPQLRRNRETLTAT